ncbi:putative laccase-9 [Rosa rugosa]|uniref:putative laccase-9 n=1 Tax=Rosa rugosa TaxID=74645 RepID=UPI002B40164F|nr:putative laccase-9 [Rosa rugosa]
MKPQMNCRLLMTEVLGFLFVFVQFNSPVQGEVHFYDFVVRERNFTKLCVTKSILVVNDSFPGPEIRVHKGDTVFVNVHNQGYYGFTIHWHGIKQPRNPWSDGPEYITQCPIPPGTNFTYEIHLSDEEGTLWWHAHSDWTRATVHGAIVILPAVGTTFPFPQPDDDETIIIASWYFGDVKELVDVAMEEGSDLPHSDAYTINGEPGDLCNCSKDTTYRRMVDYGKTYLLRIINANINAEHFFAVGDHNLTVVGLDGAYIKPINTGYLVISPGQAMDVLLEANQSPGQYYMAARQYSSEDAAVVDFDHVNVTAILEYRGNYTYQPPSFPTTLPMYLDYPAAVKFTLRIKSLATPEYPISVPLNVTTSMFITVSMNELPCTHSGCKTDQKMTSSLNNVSWAFPLNTTDVLQAYYRNISGVYTTDFPDQPTQYYNFTEETFVENILFTVQGTKVKVLNYNESVQIVFQGTDVMKSSVNHPMHMHGYSFYVVGFGFGIYNNESDPKGFNLVDPPQVTTFGVPKNGWLAIRFTANNPGVWFWHCHFERHLSWGMDTAFIVKNGGTVQTSMREPPAYMPPCNAQLDSHIKTDSTEGVNII